jgi:hypothetical protein
MSWQFPCPDRVRLALNGPSGEVLRLIALQPYRGSAAKHLINPEPIPVPADPATPPARSSSPPHRSPI